MIMSKRVYTRIQTDFSRFKQKNICMNPFTSVCIVMLIFSVSLLSAAFEETTFLNVRASGMGGALVAIADDCGSGLVNPAVISRIEDPGMYSFGGMLYPALVNDKIGQSYLAVVYPQRRLLRFKPYIMSSPAVGLTVYNLFSQRYSESVMALTLAGKFVNENLSIGVNIKSMGLKPIITEYNNIRDEDYAKTKIVYDAGMTFRLNENTVLGLVGYHLNEPDFGTKVTDPLLKRIKAGLAYQTNDFIWAFDWLLINEQFNFGMGFEQWLFDKMVGIRAGVKDIGKDQLNLSFGMSYKNNNRLFPYQLDYAFVLPLAINQAGGIHRLAFSVSYGNTPRKREELKSAKDITAPNRITDLGYSLTTTTGTINLYWSAPKDKQSKVVKYEMKYSTIAFTNIAREKGVTGNQSSFRSDKEKWDKLVDGIAELWCAEKDCPQWVYLIFADKRLRLLDHVHLWLHDNPPNTPRDFKIQTLKPDADPDADMSWITQAEDSDVKAPKIHRDYWFPPVNTAGVRLYVTAINGGTYPVVKEMEIYEAAFDWAKAKPVTVPLSVPQSAGNKESIEISNLEFGTTYYFAVKSEDVYGNVSEMSNCLMVYMLSLKAESKTVISSPVASKSEEKKAEIKEVAKEIIKETAKEKEITRELPKGMKIKSVDEGIKIFLANDILFYKSKAVIQESSAGLVLAETIKIIAEYPNSKIKIEAHTDNTGDDNVNKFLTELRARSLYDYFVGKKIATERLQCAGYGETKPIESNATESGRADNNRVEIIISK